MACIYLRQEFFNIPPFNESHKLNATNPSPREALANWHRGLRYEGPESLDDWTREDLLPYFGRMCTAVETAILRVYSSRDLPGQDEDLRGIFLPEANSGPAQNKPARYQVVHFHDAVFTCDYEDNEGREIWLDNMSPVIRVYTDEDGAVPLY